MTFILQFPTEKFAGTLKSRWIHVHQDQSECSILEEVMTKTQTIVHMEDYKSRCTKCLKNNTSFEVRIEAYRIIYRAFTKVKQYFEKKFGPTGNEEDARDRELLDNSEIKFLEEGRIMTLEDDLGKTYKFLVDGSEAKVEDPDGVVKVYKAVNNLYDDSNLNSVRFCKECAVFF